MIQGLKHLSYKELRALGPSTESKAQEGSHQYLKGQCEENGARLFWVVPSAGKRSNGTHGNIRVSLKTSETL